MATFTIRDASWTHDKTALMRVRHTVFVEGQNVPASLESDDFDPVSYYALAESDSGEPIACARLQPNGKITRIAVLEQWRRRGVAKQLMNQIINRANNQGINSLYLHAQLGAIGLYEQFGFIQCGEQFEEAGIQHIKMQRPADT